jgi:hypothetical protein
MNAARSIRPAAEGRAAANELRGERATIDRTPTSIRARQVTVRHPRTTGPPLDDTWSLHHRSLSFIDTSVSDFSAAPRRQHVSRQQRQVTLRPTIGVLRELVRPDGRVAHGQPQGRSAGHGFVATPTYARTDTAYPAGRSLEFIATFNAVPFETAGCPI